MSNFDGVGGVEPAPVGFGGVEEQVVERGGAQGLVELGSDAGVVEGCAALVVDESLAKRPFQPEGW